MKRRLRAIRWSSVFVAVASVFTGTGCGSKLFHEEQRSEGWRLIPLAESRLVAQEPRPVGYLDDLARESARRALEEEGQGYVAPGDIHVTVIDCRDLHDPRMGSFRGGESVYPASVVKMCYMVNAFDQNRLGRVELDREMWKDLRLMIGPSNNKATNRILDRLTNTTFGEKLEGRAWDSFAHKRREVARYFQELGLTGLWPANKTFDNDIRLYGRDVQWLGPRSGDHFQQSNSMTTDDTARLLYLIWRRAVVDPDACEDMLDLMHRTPSPDSAFFPSVIPEGATLYSKGGYTSLEHHDAGIFALDADHAVIVVVFTVNHNVPGGKYLHVVRRAAQLVLDDVLAEPGVLDAVEEPQDAGSTDDNE